MSFLAAAQDNGPSLGEVAKQPKTSANSRTVITDENLARGPVSTAQTGTAPEPQPTAAVEGAPSQSGITEEVPPAEPESPEHVVARQKVEQLQATLDAETKSKQDVEKQLAEAKSDSEKKTLQSIIEAKQEAIDFSLQEINDANESLSKIPFSKNPPGGSPTSQ